MRIFYNILLLFLLPLAMYKLYWPKAGKPSVGKRWPEHFGVSKKVSSVDVWFHAVSVGEVLAAIPLITQLKQQKPQCNILLTTTTATGAEQAQSKLADLVIHRYAPFDLWPCIRWFLHLHKPKQLWIMETELWPNMLHQCRQRGIPVLVANARLSAKSAAGYQKVARLSRAMLHDVHTIAAQNNRDGERFVELGLPKDKLAITGSIKFDLDLN